MKRVKKDWAAAKQRVNEKLRHSETEITYYEDEFIENSRKTEVLSKALHDIVKQTKDHIYPSCASRTNTKLVSTLKKIKDKKCIQAKYPHKEGVLGKSMISHYRKFDEASVFGKALKDVGESMNQVAEAKEYMAASMKQDVITPFKQMQKEDLGNTLRLQNKLSRNRLSYDYIRNKTGKASVEAQSAKDKLQKTMDITDESMCKVLYDKELEQLVCLQEFVQLQLDFHRKATAALMTAQVKLQEKTRKKGTNNPFGSPARAVKKVMGKIKSNAGYDVLDWD